MSSSYFKVNSNGSSYQPYWWSFHGANHETMCHSETFTTKQNAYNSIASAKQNAQLSRCFVVQDKNGHWFWRVIAANGEILCHSEAYSSRAAAENSARLFCALAPASPIKEPVS